MPEICSQEKAVFESFLFLWGHHQLGMQMEIRKPMCIISHQS